MSWPSASSARWKSTAARGARLPQGIVIKDAIADITLQQVLTRPEEFDVIATLNLNGDYLSDALAAQVGGIGIAPGGNINYVSGHAIFEATHGTAPKYANQDKVNPGSVVLSGEMMFRYLGWDEVGRPDPQGPERRDRLQAGHLRLRPPDGRAPRRSSAPSSATTSSSTCRDVDAVTARRSPLAASGSDGVKHPGSFTALTPSHCTSRFSAPDFKPARARSLPTRRAGAALQDG